MRVEFGRAQRYRYPLVCLLIAIDQLGLIRDQAGYEAKEEVVEAVVRLLKEATRTSDFLGRTADDRLMAVIPHTPPDGARHLALRLLERVKEVELPARAGAVPVTLSIGAATNHGSQTMYFDALLEAAEAALSEAAAQGGDRYVESQPEAPAV